MRHWVVGSRSRSWRTLADTRRLRRRRIRLSDPQPLGIPAAPRGGMRRRRRRPRLMIVVERMVRAGHRVPTPLVAPLGGVVLFQARRGVAGLGSWVRGRAAAVLVLLEDGQDLLVHGPLADADVLADPDLDALLGERAGEGGGFCNASVALGVTVCTADRERTFHARELLGREDIEGSGEDGLAMVDIGTLKHQG